MIHFKKPSQKKRSKPLQEQLLNFKISPSLGQTCLFRQTGFTSYRSLVEVGQYL